MKHVIVIGGGASGMAAAVTAASGGVSVTVLEKKEQLGKKLQVTGNGHCNFSNSDLKPADYHCDDAGFLASFLEAHPTQKACAFLEELGLLSHEKNGYWYPLSDQASSVVQAFKNRLKDLQVEVRLQADVKKVIKDPEGGFRVFLEQETLHADAVLLSCGSMASVRDRQPFAGYRFLEDLGLPVVPAAPALVPLYGNEGCELFWDGVRMTCTVSLPSGQTQTGEVQFTKKGISGIPVFQLSHEAAAMIRENGSCLVRIDFMPGYSAEDLQQLFAKWADRRLDRVLSGMLPSKIGPVISKKAGLTASGKVSAMASAETERLLKALKSFEYEAKGYGSMEDAQVSSGGLPLSQVSEQFEVLTVPGLYVTGELLNVDGICGGYNLHFALMSGMAAGEALAGMAPEGGAV